MQLKFRLTAGTKGEKAQIEVDLRHADGVHQVVVLIHLQGGLIRPLGVFVAIGADSNCSDHLPDNSLESGTGVWDVAAFFEAGQEVFLGSHKLFQFNQCRC